MSDFVRFRKFRGSKKSASVAVHDLNSSATSADQNCLCIWIKKMKGPLVCGERELAVRATTAAGHWYRTSPRPPDSLHSAGIPYARFRQLQRSGHLLGGCTLAHRAAKNYQILLREKRDYALSKAGP